MALRYWVGGAGTWDTTSTANWSATSGGASGASVPTTADAVIVDANSGTPGAITMTGALNANNIAVGTGGWSFITGSAPRLTVAGNLLLHYLTTWSSTAPIDISTTSTLNTNGVVISGNVVLKSGTLTFANDFVTTGNLTLANTGGTINLNNRVVNSRVLISTTSTIPSTTINFGTGNFVVHGNDTTVFDMTSVWNQTYTSGPPYNPVLRAVYPGSVGTRVFNLPGSIGSGYGLCINIEGGGDTVSFTGNPSATLRDLCFNDFTGTLANCSVTCSSDAAPAGGGANLTLSPNMQWAYSNPGSARITISSAGGGNGFFRSNTNIMDRDLSGLPILIDNCTITSIHTVSGRVTLGYVVPTFNSFNLTCGRYVASLSGSSGSSLGNIFLTAPDGIVYDYQLTGLNDQTLKRPIYLSNTSATNRTITMSGGGPSSNAKITTQMPHFYITDGGTNVYLDSYMNDLNTAGYSGNIIITRNFRMAGDLYLGSNTKLVPTANAFPFVSDPGGTNNITTNGQTLQVGELILGYLAGFRLQDNLTVHSIGKVTVDNGSTTNLILNGKELSTGNLNYVSGTLWYNLGGNIRITGSNGNVFSSVSTGTTYSGSGIILIDNTTATGTRVISAPSTLFGRTPSFNILSGTGTVFVQGATRDLNFTGFSGTWNHNGLQVNGNLILSPTMSISGNGNVLTFAEASQSTTINVTTSGQILDFPIIQNDTATTTRRLTNNLRLTSTRAFVHTQGIFNLNDNHAIFGIYQSSGASTKQLAFANSGTMWVTGVNNTVVNLSGSAFTITGGQGKLVLSNTVATGTRIINIASTLPDFNINVEAGSDNVYVTGEVGDLALYGFSGLFDQGALTVAGNVYLSSTANYKASSNILTLSQVTVKNVQTNGATFQFPVTFNNASGTWWLAGNANVASNVATTLTAGTLNLNNTELSTGIFVSTGSASRTIVFGTRGQINLTGNASNVLLWDASAGYTNLTNGRIFSSYTGSTGTRTFYVVASEFASPNIQVGPVTAQSIGVFNISVGSAATDNISLEGSVFDVLLAGSGSNIAPTSNTLTIYGNVTLPAGRTAFPSSATITWAGTRGLTKLFDGNSVTINRPVTVSMTIGNVRITNNVIVGSGNITTHTSSNINLNVNSWTTGSWFTSGATARRVDFGTGQIILSGSNTQIWDMTTPTNWTFSGTKKVTSTYAGSTGTRYITFGSSLTTQQFNVSANTASEFSFGTSGTDTVSITGNIGNLSLTGFTGGFANNSRIIHGNLTIPSGANLVAGTGITVINVTVTTSNIDTNDVTLGFPVTLGVTTGGTYRLISNLRTGITNVVTYNSGNLNLNNSFINTNAFASTTALARTIQFGTTGGVTMFGGNSTILNLSGTIDLQGTFNWMATYNGTVGTRTFTISSTTFDRTWGFSANAPATGNTVIITGGSDSLQFTGAVNDLIMNGYAGTLLNGNRTIYGNLLITTPTIIQGGTGALTFDGTNKTSVAPNFVQNINTNSVTLNFPVVFGITSGGTYRLINNLTLGNTNTAVLTSGNLNLNNSFLVTNTLVSTSAIARVIQFGTTGGISVFGNSNTIINLSGTPPSSIGVQGNFNMVSTYLGSVGTRTITLSTAGDLQTAINVDIGSGTGNTLVVLGGSDTLNINGSGIRDLLLDGFTGTLANATRTLFGNLTVDAAGILQGGTAVTTFNGTGPRQTIISNGKRFDFPLTFSGSAGGQFSLGDNLTVGSANTTTFIWGTFSLNSYVLSSGAWLSNSGFTRSINFGNSKIILTGNGAVGGGAVLGLSSITGWSRTGIPTIDIVGGGAGNRLDISVSSAPEDALLDFNVNSAAGQVNFGGAYIGNLLVTNAAQLALSGVSFYGSYKIAQLGNLVQFPATNLTFSGSANRLQEIDTRGILHNYGFSFNGTGTYKLLSNLLQASDRTLTFTTGNLWLNGYTYTVGLLSATGTGTRVLTFSDGNIVLSSPTTSTVWDMNGTNFSRIGIPNVEISGGGGGTTKTISWGTAATEANSIDWKILVPTGTVSYGAGSAAGNLFVNTPGAVTLAGTTVYGNYSLINVGTLTASTSNLTFGGSSARIQRINANGFLHDQPLVFTGQGTYILDSNLTTRALRSTVFTSGNLDLNDNVLTTGVFLSNAATVRTLIFDNTGRINLTAINNTTVFSTSPSTGLQVQGNAAIYVTNNIPAGNIITITPGSVLEANTVGFWISGGAANSRVAFTTNASIRDLNFSGSASTLINANLLIYGNITLGTSGTFQGGPNTWVFASTTGQETIETDGKLITWPLRFDGVGGNWKLADDLTISNSNVLTLNSGNLDAGVFNVNVGTFNSFVANTRTLSIGTGNWTIYNNNTSFNVQNVNSFTVVGSGNIRMAGNNPKTFAGGGANTYPTLTNIGAGNLTITGNNNITTLSNEVMGVYWLFTPNTNTTITNWNINGTALNPIRIQSTVDNFVHFIRKASGSITGTYLVVKDSNVGSYGGGTWYALYSTDSGNNTGWTFSSNNANFLVMFF